MTSDLYGNPYTQLELCVFTLLEGQPSVLLVRRNERPEQGNWILPSGHLDTNQDSDLPAAARRIARDTLPAVGPFLKQQCAVGGKKRDDKHAWTVSVVYRAMVRNGLFMPIPNIKAADQRWLSVRDLDKAHDIAFNYKDIVAEAAADIRRDVEALRIPFHLLPAEFTITELQVLCEQILGASLDRITFRRRVLHRKILQETGNVKTGTAYRPAQLYRPAG